MNSHEGIWVYGVMTFLLQNCNFFMVVWNNLVVRLYILESFHLHDKIVTIWQKSGLMYKFIFLVLWHLYHKIIPNFEGCLYFSDTWYFHHKIMTLHLSTMRLTEMYEKYNFMIEMWQEPLKSSSPIFKLIFLHFLISVRF